ncbi:hypothetical protein [Nitrosospira sp. Nsp1]|uniref:virion core protein, T7 gp14 family n=1 Tax=Nitrosospira sp. Nsp1 TaxID=136547 RepID=UPI000891A0F8|nr:hypothetical protein [Nitrosospira sp. Nsp1]SCX57642.1 hypothetical protein SAMN05720354_12014 [Nitrosospira sp. Nsp1]
MCEPISISAMATSIAAAASSAAAATTAAVTGMSTASALAAGSLAVGVAGAGASYMQQNQQAKFRDKASQANYSQQMGTYKEQQDQVNKNSIDQMSQRARENMIQAARIRAVHGESGLGGNTNDRIINENSFNFGTDVSSIESNRLAQQRQLNQEAKSIRAGAQTQISQIPRPSLIGTGLQIAGSAMDAATTYKGLKAPRSKTLPLS